MSGTLEKQIQLEQEMVTGGIERFRKTKDQAITSGKESHTLHGRVIISRVVEAVAEGIRDIQQNPKSNRDITYSKIKHMDAEQVAYLAVVTMVDVIRYYGYGTICPMKTSQAKDIIKEGI